jgi:hypothetical protein
MWVVYSVVAAVFLIAGASKAANPGPLGQLMHDVWRIPDPLTKRAARGVGIAEIMIALGLLSGPTSQPAGFAAAAASCVFLVAGIVMNRRAPGVTCGCFGSLTSKLKIGGTQLALAAGLLAASVVVVGAGETNGQPALAFLATSAVSLGVLGTAAWRAIRSLPKGLLYPVKASVS